MIQIQIQIQIRQWKQVATQTSTAPQRELTLRKTHNSRPRSQRPRGKAAQCPCPQRINADKGHRSVRTITQKNYTSRFVRVIFAQEVCKSSLYRSTGDPRIVRAPGPCNFHRITRVDVIVVKKLQERAAPFVLLHRSKKSTNTYILELCVSSLHRGHAQCFKFSMCHHASKKKKKVLQMPNTHQRLLKYVWSAIPVQIDS